MTSLECGEVRVAKSESCWVENDPLALEEDRCGQSKCQTFQGVLDRVDEEFVEVIVCFEDLLFCEGEDLLGQSQSEVVHVCH